MRESTSAVPRELPDYLRDTYTWAYLDHRTLPWLDRPVVVSAILWGNADRLMSRAVSEFKPGQQVLQAAAVYGDFSPRLARQLGEGGELLVLDVAPIQIANTRRKLARWPLTTHAQVADLTEPVGRRFDGVCCFFLLHEVPSTARRCIVANLLNAVEPGGKIVFVDYHKPRWWHPMGPVMALVFRYLEPFANSLLDESIETLVPETADFEWRKETFFGGLYQKVVGIRR
ncbi:rhodoquinone biosynthesis methyltransferase RquA [Zoogloea sp.]|jgi:SAM-dependent methyltransferase|uniref:rhodoquinone biosynthesis methyltransferase RquA n=1 Tax=Zoogloea sp. TaxID=49181 RepID=UPI001B5B5548|nr:rhodoquinone biosynthesis methyltransferase RquA [Zoogloea sp.]MBK6655390.1 class I SAM-dependent methyltransferase [Zoogloea sp.]MBK7848370.1 class I SAM-dependent methyltransferase [Zoogloea sp.]MBP7445726.1 rhodoquinone biosynthesis methyltransferase RquA [Zoogloea sp.]